MLKKAGLLTVGVSAALLTASPMAFAGNADADHNGSDNDHGHHKSWDDNDHGHGHGHHKGHGQHGVGNTSCASESGSTKHNDTEGILALGPILNGNSGQILSCNSFLNDVASGNHINALNS